MAIAANSAPACAWNTQYENYLNLTQKLEQAPPHEREPLERAIAEVQDDLLDTPAPSLTAVLRKLEWMWEGQLLGIDREAEERRLGIDDLENLREDLEGLIQAQRELLGA